MAYVWPEPAEYAAPAWLAVTFNKTFNCQHMERMFDAMEKHPKDSRNNREMDCESYQSYLA